MEWRILHSLILHSQVAALPMLNWLIDFSLRNRAMVLVAVLTVIVALGAAQLRVGLVDRLDGPSGARAMAIVETLAGAVVVILATQVVLRLM